MTMTWQITGTIQPVTHWVSLPVPDGADPTVVRIAFVFQGGLRIYSRILLRLVYDAGGDAGGDWVRGKPTRIFPDLNEQIISFSPVSGGVVKFIEIKKGFRSWRWRSVPDPPHLIQIASFVSE